MVLIKRFIILLLVFSLCIPFLAVPALATSSDVVGAIEDQTDSLGEWLGVLGRDIVDGLTTLDDSMAYWNQTFQLALQDILDTHFGNVGTLLRNLGTKIDNAATKIDDGISALGTKVETAISTWVQKSMDNTTAWFETLLGNVDNWIKQLRTAVDQVRTTLDATITAWCQEIVNSMRYWFEKLINGSSADQEKADGFNDDIIDSGIEFGDAQDQIDNVTHPELDEEKLDLDDKVSVDWVSYLEAFFAYIFNNKYIYVIFFISLIFGLVSYGIFGKR